MSKHFNYYILETIILGLGFFVLYALTMSLYYQMMLIFGLVIIYSAIGILHHMVAHDIHLKIVLEYIIISALVIAIFVFLKSGSA